MNTGDIAVTDPENGILAYLVMQYVTLTFDLLPPKPNHFIFEQDALLTNVC